MYFDMNFCVTVESKVKMEEGNPCNKLKHWASLNKSFVSLYCTNFYVYFDNKLCV